MKCYQDKPLLKVFDTAASTAEIFETIGKTQDEYSQNIVQHIPDLKNVQVSDPYSSTEPFSSDENIAVATILGLASNIAMQRDDIQVRILTSKYPAVTDNTVVAVAMGTLSETSPQISGISAGNISAAVRHIQQRIFEKVDDNNRIHSNWKRVSSNLDAAKKYEWKSESLTDNAFINIARIIMKAHDIKPTVGLNEGLLSISLNHADYAKFCDAEKLETRGRGRSQ